MTESRRRVFSGELACPFENCHHHRFCIGAWRHEAECHVPTIEIEHELPEGDVPYGGKVGAAAWVVCFDWLPMKEEGNEAE